MALGTGCSGWKADPLEKRFDLWKEPGAPCDAKHLTHRFRNSLSLSFCWQPVLAAHIKQPRGARVGSWLHMLALGPDLIGANEGFGKLSV